MDRKNYIQGLIYGLLAFVIWGFLPIYWKLVNALSPYQIFGQRVLWSFVFVMFILKLKREEKMFIVLVKDLKNLPVMIMPVIAISINWMLYIWAVNNGYVIEASLGYYINPLVLTLIGSVFLKEKMDKLQKIGVFFALSGVLIKSVFYGRIPYIAIILAVTFAFYGVTKKRSPLKSLYGLGFETYIMGIPSLAYIVSSEIKGLGISGNLPWHFWVLIAFSGIATATPLILYAESAKRLPLTVMGFLQYIAPTIMLLLGIFVFREPFDFISGVAFGLIWIGLGFFSYSQYRLLAKTKN